jgi:hypothetical protein
LTPGRSFGLFPPDQLTRRVIRTVATGKAFSSLNTGASHAAPLPRRPVSRSGSSTRRRPGGGGCPWPPCSSALIALARACPAVAASPGPRRGFLDRWATVAIPDRAAATRRTVWISASPEPISPRVWDRPREIQGVQRTGQPGRPPGDQRQLIDLVLAVHPGEGHQRRLGQVWWFRAGVAIGLLGATGR